MTAEAAAAILRAGGNAADAATSALAMACVAEPVLAAPGGGGFAMIRDGASGAVTLIDFFPQTPLHQRPVGDDGVQRIVADFGTATQAFHIGPATSAAPGFFAGIAMLQARHGAAPLADLFTPAIRAARDGVIMTPYQHYLSTVVGPILTATPQAAALFAPNGAMVAAGDRFANPGLADALETMLADGFAGSAVGAEIVAQQAGRGHLGQDDLDAYRAVERAPLTVMAGAARIHLNPPPAAGGALVAHILEQLPDWDSATMAAAQTATDTARRAAGTDLSRLIAAPLRARGTTHVSVTDAAGNCCAVTVSNGEGNGELVGEFGFMLNNILGEEDVNPPPLDVWPTNVRLASMMCPTIVEQPDGGVVAFGSGGSNRIRSAIAQVVARLCLARQDVATAIAAPRLHVEDGHLDFEDLFTPGERARLTAAFADHRAWREPNMFFGGVHAVRRAADGACEAVGDVRRDGVAIVL